MQSLEFTINQNLPLHFEGFLFNEPIHVHRQQASKAITFHLSNNEVAFANFNLFIDNDQGYSPFRAPFGSIELDKSLKKPIVTDFLDRILIKCQEEGLKKITIVMYPHCYAKRRSKLLDEVFRSRNFAVKYNDLNFHIPVTNDFDSNLHYSEKRKLTKTINAEFEVKIDKGIYIPEMYRLIKDTRERKGFPISMKESELALLFKNFPDRYEAFTLWDNKNIIACAVGVKINSNILYYYLPADNVEYRYYSPTVLLIKHMFDYCKKLEIGILDLGIATDKGVRNEGLIRFKENLGGLPSPKLTIEKEL